MHRIYNYKEYLLKFERDTREQIQLFDVLLSFFTQRAENLPCGRRLQAIAIFIYEHTSSIHYMVSHIVAMCSRVPADTWVEAG